ncbi:MAG: potassium channel family protein [Oligoflexus sp.]|jgi:voltage-gated potassium channel
MLQLLRLLLILIVLPIIGTIGFMIIEDLRLLDAAYMAFITLSTVGYEVVKPLSDSGKLFIIVYLVLGFSLFFYSLTQIGEIVVNGELQRILGGRLMHRQIKSLSNHAIICGLGRMGQGIAKEMHRKGEPFVVIDLSAERFEMAMKEGWACIKGDASEDDILQEAGIEHARCLATVLPHDADNLFCVMSARLLNKNMTIITRASSESAIDKLRRAGATRIVSPYSTGAVKIAQLMHHPELEDFIEIFTDRRTDIDLTVFRIEKNSPLVGRCLRDLNLIQQGVMIIGLRRDGQKIELPPPVDIALKVHDTLIAVGKAVQLSKVLARPAEP